MLSNKYLVFGFTLLQLFLLSVLSYVVKDKESGDFIYFQLNLSTATVFTHIFTLGLTTRYSIYRHDSGLISIVIYQILFVLLFFGLFGILSNNNFLNNAQNVLFILSMISKEALLSFYDKSKFILIYLVVTLVPFTFILFSIDVSIVTFLYLTYFYPFLHLVFKILTAFDYRFFNRFHWTNFQDFVFDGVKKTFFLSLSFVFLTQFEKFNISKFNTGLDLDDYLFLDRIGLALSIPLSNIIYFFKIEEIAISKHLAKVLIVFTLFVFVIFVLENSFWVVLIYFIFFILGKFIIANQIRYIDIHGGVFRLLLLGVINLTIIFIYYHFVFANIFIFKSLLIYSNLIYLFFYTKRSSC